MKNYNIIVGALFMVIAILIGASCEWQNIQSPRPRVMVSFALFFLGLFRIIESKEK